MIHNNQSLLYVSYSETSATASCGTTGIVSPSYIISSCIIYIYYIVLVVYLIILHHLSYIISSYLSYIIYIWYIIYNVNIYTYIILSSYIIYQISSTYTHKKPQKIETSTLPLHFFCHAPQLEPTSPASTSRSRAAMTNPWKWDDFPQGFSPTFGTFSRLR